MLATTLRGLWDRKRRLAGIVLAVALGVAFLAGSLAFSDTLSANFTQLFSTATAGASAVVRSSTTVGGRIGGVRPRIPASLVPAVWAVPGVADAQPSISGAAILLGADGKPVGGLGPARSAGNWIPDPALTPYRLAAGHAPQGMSQIVIDRGAAAAGGLRIGSHTTVLTPAPVRVTVVGLATFGTADSFGGATYTAFSLPAAERYLARTPGQVSAIEVRAAPGVSPAILVRRLNRVLPPGVQAITAAQLTQTTLTDLNNEFLSTLRLFLDVFAGIALVVAAFSIASTFGVIVAQRTREAALLRVVGATRRQIFAGVLTEAVVVGIAGSAIGLAGGIGVDAALKGVFDSAGFDLPAGGLVVTGGTVAVSLLAGLALTVVVGLLPAWRAARVAPLAALRSAAAETGRPPRRRAVAGLVLLVGGAAVLAAGLRGTGNSVVTIVGAGAALLTAGFVALGPAVAGPAADLLGRLLAGWRGVAGTLARRNVVRSPRRAASAATALMIGVAVVTLFTVYAASLRAADINGVDNSFTGDIAVTGGGFGGGAGRGVLSPELAGPIAKVPGVATAVALDRGQAQVGGQSGSVTAVDPATVGQVLDLHPVAGSISGLTTSQIAVSQVQAAARHWSRGTSVSLVLPDGTRHQVTIGAIYSSRNLVGDYVLPLGLWSPHVQQLTASALLVKLAPGASEPAVQAAVSRAAASYGGPAVQDRAAFVASAGKSLSTVLTIVYALLVLAIVIAVLGIANTLSLSVYERTREIGLLRAVGQTRAQLRSMVRVESVIVSAFGTAGGLVLGGFLGWAMSEAGARAQGLTLFALPAGALVLIAVLGGLAGVAAAVRPARRAARLPVLEAIAAE